MRHGRLLVARAPGRVNLIGDHTDYNDGLALPMAVDLATEVCLVPTEEPNLHLTTTLSPDRVTVPVDVALDDRALAAVGPPWGRLAAAVVALARPAAGGRGTVTSTVPAGAGLSSSAAFCVALAMACGVDVPPPAMARLCQRAEAAAGARVGLMDPLASAAGVAGHALLVDFASLSLAAVPVPPAAEVVVVHSGERRQVGASPYAARRAECEAAAVAVGGPLGRAEEADLAALGDRVLRARARHVVGECRRVRAFAAALVAGDLAGAGDLMAESHRSTARDFEASTPGIDALVDRLSRLPGVYGARVTGAGFGGCVVALAEPGAVDPADWPQGAWRVRPAGGASLRTEDLP